MEKAPSCLKESPMHTYYFVLSVMGYPGIFVLLFYNTVDN